MFIDYMESPLGTIELKASSQGIVHVIFCGDQRHKVNANDITKKGKQQLKEYFAGERKEFDLPLDPKGTDFQKKVWRSLVDIPFGKTLSYGDIAQKLNNVNAVRAVGGANGRNPISIIVPCHRVIGSNGALTGYAGGVERKLWLLKHEEVAIKETALTHALTEKLKLEGVIQRRQDKTQFLD